MSNQTSIRLKKQHLKEMSDFFSKYIMQEIKSNSNDIYLIKSLCDFYKDIKGSSESQSDVVIEADEKLVFIITKIIKENISKEINERKDITIDLVSAYMDLCMFDEGTISSGTKDTSDENIIMSEIKNNSDMDSCEHSSSPNETVKEEYSSESNLNIDKTPKAEHSSENNSEGNEDGTGMDSQTDMYESYNEENNEVDNEYNEENVEYEQEEEVVDYPEWNYNEIDTLY